MALGLGEIKVKLGLDNSGLEKGLKESKTAIGGFGEETNRLAGALAGLGIGFASAEFGKFAREAFNLSEQFKPVQKAFAASGANLESLRRATGGAVSDFELLKQTVQAGNFGIAGEELAKAFKFATIRAAETGQSVDYLTQSIVTGIGRKSPLILDNLGISLVDIQEEMKKTGDFTVSVGNIIDRELGKSTITIDETATSAASLSASFDNLKLAFGNVLNSNPQGFFASVSRLIQEAADNLTSLSGSFTTPADELIILEAELESTQTGIGKFIREATASSIGLGGFSEGVEQLKDRIRELKVQLAFEAVGRKAKEELKPTVDTLASLEDELKSLQEVFQGLDINSAAFKETRTDIANLSERIKQLKNDAQSASGELRTLKEIIDDLVGQDFNIKIGIDTSVLNNLVAEDASFDFGIQDLPIDEQAEAFKYLADSIALSKYELQALGDSVAEVGEPFIEGINLIEEAVLDLSASLTNLITEVLVEVGQALGDALTGDFDGSAFINSLAQFGQNFGKELVAIGVATLALQAALSNPYTAIAAGVGLIAVSQAIKNLSSSAGSALASGNLGSLASVSASGQNAGGVLGQDSKPPEIKIYLGQRELTDALKLTNNLIGKTG